MRKRLYIVIGCDTDPDRAGFVDGLPTDGFGWSGMLDGIPRAKDRLNNITDSEGHPPVFTWCLRVDYQIKKTYGEYDYILTEHRSFLEDLERAGDELGWHPHFWRYDDNGKYWYQEVFDTAWQLKMLDEAYAAYTKQFPGKPQSVRMGWDFHNNETFQMLQELGIKIDFSAVPGLKFSPKDQNKRAANFLDWSLSPDFPYYASPDDYRRNAAKGGPSREILEAPNFVSRSIFWSLIGGLVYAKKMKDFGPVWRAIKRPTYWINITGRTGLFSPLVSSLKRRLAKHDKAFFVTYFHPDELIVNKSTLYSLDYMETNLKAVIGTAKEQGAEIKFIQACEVLKYL